MISVLSIPRRYTEVIDKFACPSWRWMTSRGRPSTMTWVSLVSRFHSSETVKPSLWRVSSSRNMSYLPVVSLFRASDPLPKTRFGHRLNALPPLAMID